MTSALAEQPPVTIEYLDPADLIIGVNTRVDPRLDEGFLASVRTIGVRVPILAVRTKEGEVRVRMGQRRTLAAIKGRRATVPVMIVADEATGTAAEIDRIVEQFAENHHRTGLTAAEEAGAVAQLLDLGLTTKQIERQTSLPQAAIHAAQMVARSKTATAAAASYDLTIHQAADVAGFEDDDDAVGQLVTAAKDGEGQFAHTLQQLRDAQAERGALAEAKAAFEAAGVAVVDKPLGWEHSLRYLEDADGATLTPETHAECPGRTAYITVQWGPGTASRAPEILTSHYCYDPEGNGHKPMFASRGTAKPAGVDAEAAREERRQVIDGNKKWRSAETVRRAWLREFLARKTAPAGGLRFVLESVARMDYAAQNGLTSGHTTACDLLGLKIPDRLVGIALPDVAMAAVAGASDARAQVIALGLVLGAYEGSTGVHTWRGPNEHVQRYFKALAGWGYTLSGIEQGVAGGVSDPTRGWRDGQPPAIPATDGDEGTEGAEATADA